MILYSLVKQKKSNAKCASCLTGDRLKSQIFRHLFREMKEEACLQDWNRCDL